MKKIIFGLVATSCLVGANGVSKLNKNAKFLEPEVKRINGDVPTDHFDAVCCANHYYFEDLHGWRIAKLNSNKKNGLVIIQQLLGYYDAMIDDQMIPENYEWKVDDYISDPDHPTMEQFNDSPSSNEAYYDHIKSVYTAQKYKYNEDAGTTHAQDKKVLRKLFREYNNGVLENNLYIEPCDNNPMDQWSDYSQRLATEQIHLYKNPVIVRKGNEVGIAYAFNRNYVWLAEFNEMGGYWNGHVKKDISFLDNAYVLAVKSNCFNAYRAYSDNYAFYSRYGKRWIGTHDHVLSTPNFDGYHDYYAYTDYDY